LPVYDYEHSDRKGPECDERFELAHSINEKITVCPICGHPVRKIVSRFSHHRNILATSRLKEHGFKRMRRRDKGVYEED